MLNTNILDLLTLIQNVPAPASWIWRGVDTIRIGAYYVIGDGSKMDVWKDQWIPWIDNYKPNAKGGLIAWCQDLSIPNEGLWCKEKFIS